jgi:hypothetical protein
VPGTLLVIAGGVMSGMFAVIVPVPCIVAVVDARDASPKLIVPEVVVVVQDMKV